MKRPPIPGERPHSELYWRSLEFWDAFKYVVLCPSILLCLLMMGASGVIIWWAQ